MIDKFLETLYSKVFINIVVESLQTVVYVEVRSKKEVLANAHRVFETTSINAKMYDFIRAYFKESPYHYVSILDKSSNQGAVPSCDETVMGKYADMSSVEHKCYEKKWAFYTSEYDLEAIKHEYRSIGTDFIFSPFAVMADFFKDKIDSSLAMFVLVEDNYISFCVFDNSKLLFAEHIDMQHHKEDDDILIDTSLEDDEISLDIEGVDLDDMSISDDSHISFEDFTNIEDLDEGDDIDEFSQMHDTEEEERVQKDVDISSEGFNDDYQRFSLIQSALNTFYRDPKYESQFIETIYIADGIGVSADLKSYLEEEMFLNVYIRKIDIPSAICDLAKAELDEI